jgi:DNA-binding response OmpR family regulator
LEGYGKNPALFPPYAALPAGVVQQVAWVAGRQRSNTQRMSSEHDKTVLVVDDDPGIRDMVRDWLAPSGYNLLYAKSGKEGTKIFRRQRVDLVLLDVFMPDRDGIEVLMELKRIATSPKVVMMSGGGVMKLEQVLKLAGKLGATDTLPKPFTPAELTETVHRLIGNGNSAGATVAG